MACRAFPASCRTPATLATAPTTSIVFRRRSQKDDVWMVGGLAILFSAICCLLRSWQGYPVRGATATVGLPQGCLGDDTAPVPDELWAYRWHCSICTIGVPN